MQKTIYVSDNDQELFAKAQEVLGESSISATIAAALRYVIEHEAKELPGHELKDGQTMVVLYGEEVPLFADESDKCGFPAYRAFKTKSGKIVVAVQTESDQKLLRYKSYDDFKAHGGNDLPLSDPRTKEVFLRIDLALHGIPNVEVID